MDSITINSGSKISKTIHLIRHGQTDFNKKNIIQGSGVNSLLNETGVWQAQQFYKYYNKIPYQKIYTSQLTRAIQSVHEFIAQGISHQEMPELNEINWGIMEGKESSPERHIEYQKIVDEWSSGNLDIAIANGETPNVLFERQKRGLEKIMAQQDEELVLICMHGRAMRSFLCLLTNTPLKDMEKWEHSNLCLYELEFNGNCFDVIKANDTKHLSD